MAIRIIKTENPAPMLVVYTAQCYYCRTKIEFNESDWSKDYTPKGYSEEHHHYVLCPGCKSTRIFRPEAKIVRVEESVK